MGELCFANGVRIAADEIHHNIVATGEEWLDQLNFYLHDNFVFVHDYLKEHLSLAKISIPEGTYFAWVDMMPYLQGAAKADMDSYLVKVADILIESGPIMMQENPCIRS